MHFQENRREYEKRVASIVEQSWYIIIIIIGWMIQNPFEGWCFLKRVKARRWRGNPQQTEKEIVAKTMSTILFIFSDADKWILQTRNYYSVNSWKFIFRLNSSKIYTVTLESYFREIC